jgi:hypothetical protein
MEELPIKEILGMPPDAVLYGLFGGLIMLTRMEKTNRAKALSTVLSSMVIAGTGAELFGDFLVHKLGVFDHTSFKTIRIASALFLGACWQKIIYISFIKLNNWKVDK